MNVRCESGLVYFIGQVVMQKQRRRLVHRVNGLHLQRQLGFEFSFIIFLLEPLLLKSWSST